MNIWKSRSWKPMLLKELEKPFDSKDYLFELKYDGIRAVIFVNQKDIYIQSRNGQDLTNVFPELHDIKKLVDTNIIFDGEIVSLYNNNISFSKIQERLHLKTKHLIKEKASSNPVCFMVFDILYENKDLTNLELIKRKKILNKYKDNNIFIKIKTINNTGIKLFDSVKKLNLEGIIAKKKNGLYYINKRCDEFIKIKNIQRDEFIVGGYLEKKNGILSLAIGEYINNNYCYVGKVSINKNASIYDKIKKEKLSKNYFCNYEENINFIKPKITCHVEYLERTKNNHLRHPIFKDI